MVRPLTTPAVRGSCGPWQTAKTGRSRSKNASREVDHPLVRSQVIRGVATREEERIELVGCHLGDPVLRACHFLPLLAGELGVGPQPDHHHLSDPRR